MIYFNNISPKINPKSYLKKRLEKLLASFPKKEQTNLINGFSEQNRALPLFTPIDESSEANSVISETKKSIVEQYPLFKDEIIKTEEIVVRYTAKSSDERGTFFVKQTTNFADVYIQVPTISITNGQIIPLNESQKSLQIAENTDQIVTFIPAWVLAIAQTLGQKLLSQLGTMAWDKIRKDVLQEKDLPKYFEEVYDQIRKIVDSAFQELYLKDVKDKTSKFELALNNYNNFGRNENDFTIVKDTVLELITKSESLGIAGNFHYTDTAVLYLMTLQESYKRLKEKSASADELNKARNYISETAKHFSENIKKKHQELLDLRMSKISKEPYQYVPVIDSPIKPRIIGGVKEGAFDADGTFCYSLLGPMNMFKDDENNFWNSMHYNFTWEWNISSGFTRHSWNWVNNNLQAYREQIKKETLESIQKLLDVAEDLKKLSEKPIPDGE